MLLLFKFQTYCRLPQFILETLERKIGGKYLLPRAWKQQDRNFDCQVFLVQGMKEILGKQQQLGDLSAFIFFNESGSHLIEKLFGQFFQYYINDKKIMKCCVNNSNFQHKQLILLIKLPMIIRKINYSCCRLKHILATFHQLMFHYFISLSKYKSVLETYNLK